MKKALNLIVLLRNKCKEFFFTLVDVPSVIFDVSSGHPKKRQLQSSSWLEKLLVHCCCEGGKLFFFLDLSIVGSNPVCDTVLKTFFLSFWYRN